MVAIASFAALTLLVEQQQEHLTSKTCWNYPPKFSFRNLAQSRITPEKKPSQMTTGDKVVAIA